MEKISTWNWKYLLMLFYVNMFFTLGPFKCYVMQMGVGEGVSNFPKKKRYKGVRFNIISVMGGGGWGSNFQEKSIS